MTNPVQVLAYFVRAFSHLSTAKTEERGVAPHKPILLLSVLHEYEVGRIGDRRIFITPELTHTFSTLWNQLAGSAYSKGFALPFYHLKSEKGGWWKLVPNPGFESSVEMPGSMRSFGNLSTAVAYAEIDRELAALFLEKKTREILQKTLFDTYFPEKSPAQTWLSEDGYFDELRGEMMEESSTAYKARIQGLKTKLDPETYQIEVFNRGTLFRREVVKLYDETCCVTGLRVSATFTITMVDACHIVPFAASFDNSLTNGIALCPNLHRAFDRGLFSVDENYRVMLSQKFTENEASSFGFHTIAGVELNLPRDRRFLPSRDAFAWHREHVFQG